MIIRKPIDFIKGNPYPKGHAAASTLLFNTDEGRLHIKSEAMPLLALPEPTPDWMQLRFILRPIPLFEVPAVHLVHQDEDVIKHGTLYHETELRFINARHRAIELIYTGLGRHDIKDPLHPVQTEIENDAVAHRYDFLVQAAGEIHLHRHIENERVITTPPGCAQGYPLWGYGGYYRPGISLEQMEQVFFSFHVDQEVVETNLLSASYFKQKGIFPQASGSSQGVMFAFIDFPSGQSLSLKDEILTGRVIMRKALGKDEMGQDVLEFYDSFDVGQIDSNTIDISFMKRSNG